MDKVKGLPTEMKEASLFDFGFSFLNFSVFQTSSFGVCFGI
jgi:hypothetical protein